MSLNIEKKTRQLFASNGGIASANKLTPAQRKRRAKKAARARWNKLKAK